ncbi:hypothetical protein BDP27DRAFT_1448362 [Rhodocollybia butyracea]|uniref:Uncharacterized protein n=1 Tax=Rhodocollybia butyracea TaxID=206335 RepID=A0A9P5U648_9AGAR|nr:hypothetical protein BDP27DRAFT_1448362 [Rhodocollybia butyracea]
MEAGLSNADDIMIMDRLLNTDDDQAHKRVAEISSKASQYDRGDTSKKIALGGLIFTTLFSTTCMAVGVVVALHPISPLDIVVDPESHISNDPVRGIYIVLVQASNSHRELIGLALNVLVTLCTEVVGFTHSAALKSALIWESRLHFNTNLRLFTSARNPRHSTRSFLGIRINFNGRFVNFMMAILLIMSYVSSSLILLPFQPSAPWDKTTSYLNSGSSSWLLGTPIFLLGFTLFVQAVFAFGAFYTTPILTWSSSAFSITAALVEHGMVVPCPNRCMHTVRDHNKEDGPQHPLRIQPSPWEAHPRIRRVIILLWALVPVCFAWGGIAWGIGHAAGILQINKPQSFAFLPNKNTTAMVFDIEGSLDFFMWFMNFLLIGVIQGSLTLGLHCTELINNVVRDELTWRRATSRDGLRLGMNPVMSVISSAPTVALLIAKPLLHWLFGLSFNAQGDVNEAPPVVFLAVSLCMRPAQIWYLGVALLIFAASTTLLARWHPKGPQPAVYGHIQVLADLVDEWYPVMWWGEKGDGHAGIADHPLPDVDMDLLYM